MVEIGKPITKEQKELFQKLLTIENIVDLAAESTLSYSTFRELFYRKADVTETNKEAVYKMISKAFQKTEESIVYFAKAKSQLEAMLPKSG
jgi:DNA topoisomerase VI subunit A